MRNFTRTDFTRSMDDDTCSLDGNSWGSWNIFGVGVGVFVGCGMSVGYIYNVGGIKTEVGTVKLVGYETVGGISVGCDVGTTAAGAFVGMIVAGTAIVGIAVRTLVGGILDGFSWHLLHKSHHACLGLPHLCRLTSSGMAPH